MSDTTICYGQIDEYNATPSIQRELVGEVRTVPTWGREILRRSLTNLPPAVFREL